MIEELKYRASITRLFRQKERIRKLYANDIRKAQTNGNTSDDVHSIEESARFENQAIDEEIAIVATDNLIRKARREFVPIPPHTEDGMWVQCSVNSQRYILTDRGISTLRSSLISDQKKRAEIAVMVITALTGIIGVLTGLVAVILKLR